MARKPRFHVPGGLCHVITRGNNRQTVFGDDTDRAGFLTFMEDYARRMGIIVLAYVLMENHVHMLVEVGEKPLSEFMRRLLGRFTQRFNRRHGRVGHLFQGRYKAILCERESYLKELVRYIHLNPVRAGIVAKPESYAWSSHRAYVGLVPAGSVAVDRVLGMFGRSRDRAREAFGRFVQDGMNQGHRPEFYRVTEGRYLGSDEFLESVRAKEARMSRRLSKRRFPRMGLDELAEGLAVEYQTDVQTIKSLNRTPPLPAVRSRLAFEAVVLHGHKGVEVARWLGCDPSSVTKAIRRKEEKVNVQD